jgi:L-2-hydroxyglutarate oxidase LhgO
MSAARYSLLGWERAEDGSAPIPDQCFDVVIIGGGIVGLSTAMHPGRLLPRTRLLLVEKEDGIARHQSGHNSGVIHSGIYYKPGSLKARLCVEGAAAMVEFCRRLSAQGCIVTAWPAWRRRNFRSGSYRFAANTTI